MPTSIRLRPGVHAAPLAGALLITGRGTSRLVRGDAQALDAAWLKLLALLHDGAEPYALQALGDHAEEIIKALADAGLLLPGVGQASDPTLAYLEAVADRPIEALERFRALRVRVVGSGPASLALKRTLMSAGLPATHLGSDEADIVVTIDAEAAVPEGAAWLGVMSCGDRVVVGPLRPADGGLSLDDALAALGATSAPTSPVAATLAGNLAAFDVFEFGAGLPAAARWRTSVVHVDGARVESVLVAEPGARPLSDADTAPASAGLGPLRAPAPAADYGGPGDVAQCGLPDGRTVLALGGDPGEAANNALLAAARSVVPQASGTLWRRDGSAVVDAVHVSAAAGTSADGFLRDGVRRILSSLLRGDASAYLSEQRSIPAADLPSALAAGVSFFERMRIPLTVAVSGVRGAPRLLSVATVGTHGRVLGVDCAADEETALAGALSQAMLVVQRGADCCPTHADDEKWDPRPVLDALAAAGAPVVTGRWIGAPASSLPAVLGWAGLAGHESKPEGC